MRKYVNIAPFPNSFNLEWTNPCIPSNGEGINSTIFLPKYIIAPNNQACKIISENNTDKCFLSAFLGSNLPNNLSNGIDIAHAKTKYKVVTYEISKTLTSLKGIVAVDVGFDLFISNKIK